MAISDIKLIDTTMLDTGMTKRQKANVGEQLMHIGMYLTGDLFKEDQDRLNPIYESTLVFMKSLVEQIREYDKEAQHA